MVEPDKTCYSDSNFYARCHNQLCKLLYKTTVITKFNQHFCKTILIRISGAATTRRWHL